MPTLPLIFDTILGLGATGPHATFPHPSLHLRERSETLALVVTFSPFLAGELRRRAKIACVVLHRFHDVSPTKQNKAKQSKGVHFFLRTCARPYFQRGTITLGGK